MASFQARTEKASRRKISRQPSIEEDAKFIRKTIEEIEKGSTSRYVEEKSNQEDSVVRPAVKDATSKINSTNRTELPNTSKSKKEEDKESKVKELSEDSELKEEDKRGDSEKANGKKKTKSRARLEREQSKPSESDTEVDVDTVTVEIPRRKKRPKRISEKQRTPPASVISDSEGEVRDFVVDILVFILVKSIII